VKDEQPSVYKLTTTQLIQYVIWFFWAFCVHKMMLPQLMPESFDFLKLFEQPNVAMSQQQQQRPFNGL